MRLAISFAGRKKTHYLDLRIKSYGCLKFQGEVWAGRACAAANEEDLTTCAKFCGQGGWARGAQGRHSRAPALGRPTELRPAVGDRRSGSGRLASHQRSPGRRPPTAALGGRRPAIGRGSQPVCTDRLQLWKLRPLRIFFIFFVTNFATKSKPPSLHFCNLLLVNLFNS
jgi:hypothetical protein